MTRDQLVLKLAELGVNSNSYSLDGLRNSDCVCVVDEGNGSKVYYVERDRPEELAAFRSIEEAYDFVYATFCKWLGVKI
jgi:hypothetical protein